MARLLRAKTEEDKKPKIDLNQFFDLDELKHFYIKLGDDRFQISKDRDGICFRAVSTMFTRLQIIPSSSNTIYISGIKG